MTLRRTAEILGTFSEAIWAQLTKHEIANLSPTYLAKVSDVIRRIPVSVITGFLGSGKTTLLRMMLNDPRLSDAAVIINEFGEIGIDHLLVRQVDESVVLLPSGCLCCTVRADLASTLRELYLKRIRRKIPPFRRMLIETSGLADPAPILHTLVKDPLIAERFRLDGTIVTIDAVNAMDQLDRQAESVKQAALADRLVVTKTDIVECTALKPIIARLRRINASAPILIALHGKIDAGSLLDVGLYNPAAQAPDVERWLNSARHNRNYSRYRAHHRCEGSHDDGVRSYCLTFTKPVTWSVFTSALQSLIAEHGRNLLRVKGILNVDGEELPVVVHGVQHLFHPPQSLSAWPDADRSSRLVFITTGVEREIVERAFQELNPSAFRAKRLGDVEVA
jgi:G3E family GTPase